METPPACCWAFWFTALLLVLHVTSHPAHDAPSGSSTQGRRHASCGHSRVAHIARRWSQLHSQSLQRARELGLPWGPPLGGGYPSQRPQPHRHDAHANASASAAGAAPPSSSSSSAAAAAAAATNGRALRQEVSGGGGSANATLPIRVWVEYQGTEGMAAVDRSKLLNTVNTALGVLQKYLRVRRPPAGRLLVPPTCVQWDTAGYCNQYAPDLLDPPAAGAASELNTCGLASVNASHMGGYTQCGLGGVRCRTFEGGTGEFTDYYLYITAAEDEHCQAGAVAWALPCKYSGRTNRPILGSANLCPSNLRDSSGDEAVAVLVHELMHALGFTDDSFDKFIDADGAAVPKSQVVAETTDPYGSRVTMVVSPTVRAEAAAQFGCAELEGAALENEGGVGSAKAHWEYRWMQGELMVATNLFSVYGKPATVSRITLAFMQDTGWYDVNWDAAGFLDWGYQAGCGFVQKTCSDYIQANPGQQYFCSAADYSETTNSVCTFDGLARSKCETAQFAGSCVMRMALWSESNCLSERHATNSGDIFGWRNGATSRCVPVNWLFQTQAVNGMRYQFPDSAYKDGWTDSVCYQSSCTAAGRLQLSILGSKVDCPTGELVDLARALPQKFAAGTLGPCPDNTAACSSLSCAASCSVGGHCRAGTCHCNLLFTGPDCADKLTPDGNYTRYEAPPPGASSGGGGGGGGSDDGGVAAATGYLLLRASLRNSQAELLARLDGYKTSVGALAGVATSRVAVILNLGAAAAPATSILGGGGGSGNGATGRRLTEAEASAAAAGGGAGAAVGEGGQERRRRLAAVLEVDARVATEDQADADAISARAANATLRAAFEAALAADGLTLVPGSLTVVVPAQQGGQTPGAAGGGGGLSISDPATLKVIIIVAASVAGAALLALLLWWACSRRRGAAAARPPRAGAAQAPPPPQQQEQGRQQLQRPPPAAQYGVSYQWPAPVGPPFVVEGRLFGSAREAEEYALRVAMARSMQQAPPPPPPPPPAQSQQQQQQQPVLAAARTAVPPGAYSVRPGGGVDAYGRPLAAPAAGVGYYAPPPQQAYPHVPSH